VPHTRPTESGRIRLASAKPKGKFEGRDCEILLRHEGLAPVRLPKVDPGSGFLSGLNSCRTSDRSACLFPRSSGSWPMDARVPFFAQRGSAAATVGRNGARASAIRKGASPSPRSKRPEELEMKTRETTHEPKRRGGADAAPWLPSRREAAHEEKGPWGSA
jgi:hypothetical protein